jgi:hypothetical protein
VQHANTFLGRAVKSLTRPGAQDDGRASNECTRGEGATSVRRRT